MNKLKTFLFALGGSLVVLAGNAQAALTTEASTAITNIGTAITDMESAVWVPIGAVVVAMISLKLFKRFTNKV